MTTESTPVIRRHTVRPAERILHVVSDPAVLEGCSAGFLTDARSEVE